MVLQRMLYLKGSDIPNIHSHYTEHMGMMVKINPSITRDVVLDAESVGVGPRGYTDMWNRPD